MADRDLVGRKMYEALMRAIDWDEILTKAEDLHDKLVVGARAGVLQHKTTGALCGECVRSILLKGEDEDDDGGRSPRYDYGVH